MQQLEITDYTKYYIVEALLKLMKQKPFNEINISELVKKAGIGRSTFYRHFNDKEAVIKYYLSNISRQFRNDFNYIPRCSEDYYDLIMKVLQQWKDYREFLTTICNSHLDGLLIDFMNEEFVTLFEQGFSAENSLLPYAYCGAIYNVNLQWLKSDFAESIEKVAEALFVFSLGADAYKEMIERKKS